MGLILDSSRLIADERERFHLTAWLRARPPEPIAVSAITLSELWIGIEFETGAIRARRRRRWLEKIFRRLEVVPMRPWRERTRVSACNSPAQAS